MRQLRWESRPELLDVPVPEPGPGGVLLRVDAAGLCHTDLHLMEWPEGTMPYDLPFTLGHETSGTVVALGPGTTGVNEGDRVLVYARWGCGVCWSCLQGRDNVCERPVTETRAHGAGLGRDGGLAEYMVVPAVRHLVQISDLDPAAAAPLADAGLTPYHAIARYQHLLRPHAVAVVIGVGGLGFMAVQMLRAMSAVTVVAVDVRDSALRLAEEAGAHLALPARELTPETLRAEIGSAGAALVLDCVASDRTLPLSVGAVGMGGAISYVGRGGGTLPVTAYSVPFDCSVTVTTWGSVPELTEVVSLARSGAIRTTVQRFALEETLEAYDRLHDGAVLGRAVIVPSGSGQAADAAAISSNLVPHAPPPRRSATTFNGGQQPESHPDTLTPRGTTTTVARTEVNAPDSA
jgi:alcohol dehydrogenase, propanol-preferring